MMMEVIWPIRLIESAGALIMAVSWVVFLVAPACLAKSQKAQDYVLLAALVGVLMFVGGAIALVIGLLVAPESVIIIYR